MRLDGLREENIYSLKMGKEANNVKALTKEIRPLSVANLEPDVKRQWVVCFVF